MKRSLKLVACSLLVLIVLATGFWFKPVKASPALLDPRINRLESQVRSLQSQVNRLQSQLSRVSGSQTVPSDASPVPDESSQQFDTLAILIIELQERVSALEDRLNETVEFSQ